MVYRRRSAGTGQPVASEQGPRASHTRGPAGVLAVPPDLDGTRGGQHQRFVVVHPFATERVSAGYLTARLMQVSSSVFPGQNAEHEQKGRGCRRVLGSPVLA